MAKGLIGPNTELPGGDTERDSCAYSNAGVAMLFIQTGTAELYDQVSIPEPHTPVAIGSRARQTVQPSGSVFVQFVKGSYSVSISVRPIGTSSASGSTYLTPLLSVAREAANRLP